MSQSNFNFQRKKKRRKGNTQPHHVSPVSEGIVRQICDLGIGIQCAARPGRAPPLHNRDALSARHSPSTIPSPSPTSLSQIKSVSPTPLTPIHSQITVVNDRSNLPCKYEIEITTRFPAIFVNKRESKYRE